MKPVHTAAVCMLVLAFAGGLRAQLVVETTLVGVDRRPCDPDGKQASVTPMRASGGSGKYEWRIVGGHKPRGLKLRSNGEWKGTVDWDWFDDSKNKTAEILVVDLKTNESAFGTVRFGDAGVTHGGSPCCSLAPTSPRWGLIFLGAGAILLGIRRLWLEPFQSRFTEPHASQRTVARSRQGHFRPRSG